MEVNWLEFKLLDVSTNHPSRTEMCKQFLGMGHNIKYYCGYRYSPAAYGHLPEGTINYLGVPSLPKIRGVFFILRVVPLLIRKLFVDKPDILMMDYFGILFLSPVLWVGKLISKKTKIILDVRTLPAIERKFHREIKIFHIALKAAQRICDGFTFITQAMREYCGSIIDLRHQKVSIWSSGFNQERFDPDKYIKQSKKYFELFYHGSISLDRGMGHLIQAQKILRDKGLIMYLTLIGVMEDEKILSGLIAQNQLEDVCFILRPVPHEQIPQMIMNCDLPVIPFPHFRGWEVSSPIKLMEYMAMGKAIVLTDIRAHRDVAGAHRFAFFSKSDQPTDLAEAIEKAYIARDKLESLGKKARKRALENYTWRIQAQHLAQFLKSLI